MTRMNANLAGLLDVWKRTCQVVLPRTLLEAAAYTVDGGDCLIFVNYAGAVTITLPTNGNADGRIVRIKDKSGAAETYNITIATEGSETLDGSATYTINTNYASVDLMFDGSNWHVA